MLAAGSGLVGSAPASLIRSFTGGGGAAPSPTPSAPSPSAPSAAPNRGNIVAQDPAYGQAQADYQAALAAASGNRDASTNQSLINFGAVPDFGSVGKSLGLSDAQISAITGSIDPNDQALASQYTTSGNSVLGQLNHAHDVALSQLRAQLAARGMLESGATGVAAGAEGHNYQTGLSNAYSNLLNQLLGFQNNYLSADESARTALENSASSAYDRAVQMAEKYPGLYTPPAPPAAPSPVGSPAAVAAASKLAYRKAGNHSSPAAALAARSAGLNALYGLGG